MQARILYLERKCCEFEARIGRVQYSKTGRTLYYGDRSFRPHRGGYKWNHIDVQSGCRWWISGPHKDGGDGLYPTTIEIDEDVREEYWTSIRNQPDLAGVVRFKAPGKYIGRAQPRGETLAAGSHRRIQ